jgi:superfamily II DNA/RNA helicase
LRLEVFLLSNLFIYFWQHCFAQTPIRHGDGPLALVLAPTRELAQQIEKEVKWLL